MRPFLEKSEIATQFPTASWQQVLFKEFESALTSKTRPFPCVFGTAGFRANQLRFAFPETSEAATIAGILSPYLSEARSFGQYTSLVLICRPGPVESQDSYRRRLWSILRGLVAIDDHAWPPNISNKIDTPGWEFCFNGEPIFVVCNTPAHVLRQSRRSTSFTLTFQPRWVFDKLLGDAMSAESAFTKVRELLKTFDLLTVSPSLGHYGDVANREFAQYFLDDDNERAKCPFTTLQDQKEQIAC